MPINIFKKYIHILALNYINRLSKAIKSCFT